MKPQAMFLPLLLTAALAGCNAIAPSAAPNASVSQSERALPIGQANFGDLRLGAYPKDAAKPGLLAIGAYERSRMPPYPGLYDWALKGNVARGSSELIGRLPDNYTPRQIMHFTLKGHQLNIDIGLAPNPSAQANYLWGELPQNLQPGVYHVQLTGFEVEEKDGQLVPAPKDDIRAFYQLECYFFVSQDFAAEQAWQQTWQAQDKQVENALDALHEKLRYLEKDLPRSAGVEPTLFPSLSRTAAGDLTFDGWQLQHYWNPTAPGQRPVDANTGLQFYLSAARYDAAIKPGDYTPVQGPVRWNGQDQVRNYAFDNQEFGWKFHAYVKGSDPDMVKKINAIVDETINGLASDLKTPDRRPR